MRICGDNILGLMYHGGFYIGFICQVHQKLVPKGILCLCITRMVGVGTIVHEVLFKLGVSFDGLVSRK